jgi:hypothetical protein
MRRCRRRALEFECEVVAIAVEPFFAGLVRPNDGVAAGTKVRGRVTTRRIVTTPDVPATLADTEVYPIVPPHREAVLAAGGCRCDGNDLIEMSALRGHHISWVGIVAAELIRLEAGKNTPQLVEVDLVGHECHQRCVGGVEATIDEPHQCLCR